MIIHRCSVITKNFSDDRCEAIIIKRTSKNYISQLKYYLNFLGNSYYTTDDFECLLDRGPIIIGIWNGIIACYYYKKYDIMWDRIYYDKYKFFWKAFRIMDEIISNRYYTNVKYT